MRHLLALVGSAALVVSTAALPSSAAGHQAAAPASAAAEKPAGDGLGYYDVRQSVTAANPVGVARTVAGVSAGRPAAALRKSLGSAGLLEIDPLTGTVRVLEKLDGFLTGPCDDPPARGARLRAPAPTALGLTAADLRTFDLHRDYLDIDGTHHLSFTQKIDGKTVFDDGLQATVTRAGRLLVVFGSPVSKAATPAVASPRLATATDAIAGARRDSGELPACQAPTTRPSRSSSWPTAPATTPGRRP